MRGIIKFSAGLFIWMGVAIFAVAGVFGVKAFLGGAVGANTDFPSMLGFYAALASLSAGASIVLVGGTAFLLASIDERLEGAVGRSQAPTPRASTGAVS